MSELKTYDVIMTPSSDGSWVLKSEADKVIEELKAENQNLKDTLFSKQSLTKNLTMKDALMCLRKFVIDLSGIQYRQLTLAADAEAIAWV